MYVAALSKGVGLYIVIDRMGGCSIIDSGPWAQVNVLRAGRGAADQWGQPCLVEVHRSRPSSHRVERSPRSPMKVSLVSARLAQRLTSGRQVETVELVSQCRRSNREQLPLITKSKAKEKN